jgi:hypothetical protein
MGFIACRRCRRYFVTDQTQEQQPPRCPSCHGPTRHANVAEAKQELQPQGGETTSGTKHGVSVPDRLRSARSVVPEQ